MLSSKSQSLLIRCLVVSRPCYGPWIVFATSLLSGAARSCNQKMSSRLNSPNQHPSSPCCSRTETEGSAGLRHIDFGRFDAGFENLDVALLAQNFVR